MEKKDEVGDEKELVGYLERHHQFAIAHRDKVEIYSYSFGVDGYNPTTTLMADATPRGYSRGFFLSYKWEEDTELVRIESHGSEFGVQIPAHWRRIPKESKTLAKRGNLEMYEFTKAGHKLIHTFGNVASFECFEFDEKGPEGASRRRILVSTTSPDKHFTMFDAVSGEVLKTPLGTPKHIKGSNLFIFLTNMVYRIDGDHFTCVGYLGGNFSSGGCLDASKNLFVFSDRGSDHTVVMTLNLSKEEVKSLPEFEALGKENKEILKTKEDNSAVLSPTAFLAWNERRGLVFLYVFTNDKVTTEGVITFKWNEGNGWERKQIFKGTHVEVYEVFGEKFVVIWNDERIYNKFLMKWDPKTKTLENVGQGKFGRRSVPLSSHLVLIERDRELEGRKALMGIMDFLTGTPIDQIIVKDLRNISLLPTHPEENSQIVEALYSCLPSLEKRHGGVTVFDPVIPKELVEVIARFI